MDRPQPVIQGFYRWTDVFYQWCHEFSDEPEIRSALRGFISPSALTHPLHPLRSPDQDALELWIGTLQNGKLRLMFSSAQLEYIRYWLREMGVANDQDEEVQSNVSTRPGYTHGRLLPMPESSYLLRADSELRSISPAFYSSAKQIKDALKYMEKCNTRLIGTQSRLLEIRANFEMVRSCWHARIGSWCAIDFETWERDHRLVTEVGWSLTSWIDGSEVHEDRHLIIFENMMYTNSVYIEGNREFFLFGKSSELPMEEAKDELRSMIERLQTAGPLFLLFHSRSEDVKVLRSWKIPIDGCTTTIGNALPESGIFLVDTVDLFAALTGSVSVRRSLERLCRLLSVPGLERFHNAGNDARFTLMALKEMAGGPHLDMQREARWPNQTNASVQVEWKPWQEDSDFSDTEGVMENGAQQPEF